MAIQLSRFACHPSDTEDIRHEKFSALIIAGSCSIAGTLWSAMYVYVFGFGVTALLPLIFTAVVGSSLIVSHLTKNHYYAIYAQIICIIFITSLIQLSIGSIYDSGFVIVWALLGPMTALVFFSVRRSILWFIVYILHVLIVILLNDSFVQQNQVISSTTRLVFSFMNLSISSVVVFSFAGYFVNAAIREQKKARLLLESNLQQEIALRHNEKLATLGKLSAGIAHELNNPAAAVVRGASQLDKNLDQLESAEFALGQSAPEPAQMDAISQLQQQARDRSQSPVYLDPLDRSDLEAEVESCLIDLGVSDAWNHAPVLVDVGFDCEELTQLSGQFSREEFAIVIGVLANRQAASNLVSEISQGAGRISEIVRALKSYTYLDQAPLQTVSIHDGLDNTLVMLRSKLKHGIEVRKDYAPDLPTIEGYGSDLNQVWTNLIDNAVSAMKGEGVLGIRTHQDGSRVVVEISDSGPGIPVEIQSRVFDPFFTTKPPGEGTGLGLSISHSIIVQKHQGEISVASKPGETTFRIHLPFHIHRDQD